MICFYPLYPQSDYTELRFSLRSVEKYLKPKEVIVAGVTIPEWITNITQLKVTDWPGRKQLNIRRKIYAGLTYTREILFLSDDVYLLKPYKKQFYSSGVLKRRGESGARTLEESLRRFGKPEKDYDVHCPIFYGQDFKTIMQNFSGGCIIKSAYGNFLEIPTAELWDCKIDDKTIKPEAWKRLIADRPYFSSGPGGLGIAIPLLAELFPEKSKYEL